MHDCLKNKPIQKREQMRKRFWLFAKRLKSLDCVGFHFLQEGMKPWILILFFKKKNDENFHASFDKAFWNDIRI